jgi:hypothetical protein
MVVSKAINNCSRLGQDRNASDFERIHPAIKTYDRQMQVTLELSAEVHRRLFAEAARRHLSIEELITEFASSRPDFGRRHREIRHEQTKGLADAICNSMDCLLSWPSTGGSP